MRSKMIFSGIAGALILATAALTIREDALVDGSDTLRAEIRADREQLRSALKLVLDPTVPEEAKLLELFEKQAVVGRISGPQQVAFASTDDQKRTMNPDGVTRSKVVAIFPSSPQARAQNGFGGGPNFSYSQGSNTILVPSSEDFTAVWMGIRLAHELLHAHDYLTGFEPFYAGPAQNDTFERGEVRAHSLEVVLMNRVTKGRFASALHEMARTYPPPPTFPEEWFGSPTLSPTLQILAPFNDLFPIARSQGEMDTRTGTYVVAMNLLYADLKGLGERAKKQFYQNLSASMQ